MSLDEEWDESGLVGKMAAGRYLIVSELAADNHRTLYEAENVELGVRVTLGVVRADGTPAEPRLQTGQKLRSLDEPMLVSILDVGKLDSGDLYVATEKPAGTTLRVMVGGKPLDQRRALLIVRQVLEALAAAHAVGATHGDVKPENVVVVPGLGDERIKLADLGVAALIGGRRGDPIYSAPEAALGPIDARADIYSTGAVLFELVTGHPPFFAADPDAMRRLHAYAPLQTLRQRAPGIAFSDSLETLVATALAKSPDARYQSSVEMIAALDPVLQEIEREAAQPEAPSERRRKPNDSLLLLAKDLMPHSPVTGHAAAEPFVPVNVAREVPELPWPTRLGRLARRGYARTCALATRVLAALRALDRRLGASARLRRGAGKVGEKLGLRDKVDRLGATQKKLLAAAGVVLVIVLLALFTSGNGTPAGDDAATHIARGDKELAAGRVRDALAAYETAIGMAPEVASTPEVIEALSRVAASDDPATAIAALELIAAHGGSRGVAAITSHASTNPHAEARHRAATLAEQAGAAKQVDWVASWSLDLDQGTTCDERRRIIAKLAKTGERRAIPALQRATSTRCIQRNATAAIQRINARVKRR